jgi:hypothetical protein
MDLQNLPEIVLLKICRYADINSKLNLMETTKFFNNFIGGNQNSVSFSFDFDFRDLSAYLSKQAEISNCGSVKRQIQKS